MGYADTTVTVGVSVDATASMPRDGCSPSKRFAVCDSTAKRANDTVDMRKLEIAKSSERDWQRKGPDSCYFLNVLGRCRLTNADADELIYRRPSRLIVPDRIFCRTSGHYLKT